MKILFATSDGTKSPHYASLIPDDVRKTCDVDDVVFSTNATRDEKNVEDAGLWRAGAKIALDRGKRFVADLELKRTALDTFKTDRPKFDANLAECKRLLGIVREFAPSLRIGCYDKLPAVIGYAAGQYDPLDWHACCHVEEAELLTCVDFVCPDAYMEDVSDRNYANLDHWEAALELKLDTADAYEREQLVLVHPFYENGKRAGQYVGHRPWRDMLETIADNGATPLLWNQGDVGLDVVKQLSAR